MVKCCLVVCFSWVIVCAGNAQPVASPQAVAPLDIIASTIVDMPLGTSAIVGPEALVVDSNKKIWLNRHHPIGGDNGITVYYTKVGTYEVEIKDDKLKWLKVPLTDDIKKALVPVSVLHLAAKKK